MDDESKAGIWRQFGAVIDYLERTVTACPDRLWRHSMWDTGAKSPVFSEVWYVAYHAMFWLDLYLTGSEDGFVPPAPFTLIEQYDDGPLPERVYTKVELLDYLRGCRQRCKQTIRSLTGEMAQRRCWFPWGEPTFLELLIYNLRHVQEHAGQINLMLGQHGVQTADYPTWSRDPLA
ncbi:MAG: DinB family protein [Chloroflexi bacterium]|nr:DinB family protein [Chloroflexota bacterium]